jgi:serine/threonine-protein kinase
MATSVESTPPAKDGPGTKAEGTGSGTAPAKGADPAKGNSSAAARTVTSARSDAPAKSDSPKDARGLSAIDEMNLERTVLRRGLATQQEIEGCKALRVKHADKSLLEIMVAANVLTKGQGGRLLREVGETTTKLDVPGYQIIERLGKGSMGMVYRAKQTSVDRIVAIKVLLDALAQNKEFIKRFEREAKIAAKLSHNNIVNAIDAGHVNGHHYFVMEYIEGETIKDILEKGKVFEEKVAVEIILKVAEALKHAHERGLIHRDIKPENVILTKDRNVKLADLGLARPTADEKWAMAEAGMAIGTPYYISPEQVRGQVDVDIRADIYGLGATLYHMVTGQVPYSGDTPADVMKKHADKNCVLVPPDHLNTRLSSGLGVVVETMMAKNRENRYRNPDDLIIDLKCLLGGERPMIAEQKSDALASLAEGEAADGEEAHYGGGGATDSEKRTMAGAVNLRTAIIGILSLLLGVSILTNIVMIVSR